MIAPLAKEDYEDLVAEGLNPTLEDFDKLNAIALRFQRGKETTAANAPRVGWAGDVPFHEPTFQALAWYWEYAERVSEDAETKGTLFAYALNKAVIPGAFTNLRSAEEIEKAVKAWADNLTVTREEVARACHYAAVGFEDNPAGNDSVRSPLTPASERILGRVAQRMTDACVKLGMSYNELWTMTPSRIDEMIVAWHIEQKHELKPEMAAIDCEYKKTLREIRIRLEAEKGAKG